MSPWRSCLALVLFTAGCTTEPAERAASVPLVHETADGGACERYLDAEEYLLAHGDESTFGRWRSALAQLDEAFDAICGDTFCEGDYPNIVPLRFRCSVGESSGELRECAWTFAGTQDRVRPHHGDVRMQVKPFVCRTRVSGGPSALAERMLTAPEGALYVPLPGSERSFYDMLLDCL